MSSANFKLKRTAAASRGFLATAGFSCFSSYYDCVCQSLIKDIWFDLIFDHSKVAVSQGSVLVCRVLKSSGKHPLWARCTVAFTSVTSALQVLKRYVLYKSTFYLLIYLPAVRCGMHSAARSLVLAVRRYYSACRSVCSSISDSTASVSIQSAKVWTYTPPTVGLACSAQVK